MSFLPTLRSSTSTKLAVSLVLLILTFALVYTLLPSASWGNSSSVNTFIDGLYFSVVTITTLGFGDISPITAPARLFVSLEVITGVFIVGFYLNAVATEQANKVNKQSEYRNAEERKSMAHARLIQNIPLIIPKIDQFIIACYEVVTPIDKRNFEDIDKGFEIKYCNMYDLYNQSMLMTNPFCKPLIECFFDCSHDLEKELRFALTNNDFTYWSKTKDCIFHIITTMSTFAFEQTIISVQTQHLDVGKPDYAKFTDHISKTIKEAKETPEYQKSNLFNAYIALFEHIQRSLDLAIKLKSQLKALSE